MVCRQNKLLSLIPGWIMLDYDTWHAGHIGAAGAGVQGILFNKYLLFSIFFCCFFFKNADCRTIQKCCLWFFKPSLKLFEQQVCFCRKVQIQNSQLVERCFLSFISVIWAWLWFKIQKAKMLKSKEPVCFLYIWLLFGIQCFWYLLESLASHSGETCLNTSYM